MRALDADFSLDTFASACVASYGPRAKRAVLDDRIAPESEMHKLVAYEHVALHNLISNSGPGPP